MILRLYFEEVEVGSVGSGIILVYCECGYGRV